MRKFIKSVGINVSTHSRLKAAGLFFLRGKSRRNSFNTQPPEGGWKVRRYPPPWVYRFNTQPPEGGWQPLGSFTYRRPRFNTQPPEGGWYEYGNARLLNRVSTHSRLKAAGAFIDTLSFTFKVSTHSRLKAAGTIKPNQTQPKKVSTHSRLKAAGIGEQVSKLSIIWFQHTAA